MTSSYSHLNESGNLIKQTFQPLQQKKMSQAPKLFMEESEMEFGDPS